jgi:hypothetical protein
MLTGKLQILENEVVETFLLQFMHINLKQSKTTVYVCGLCNI